ncbi:thermonuclease family protein [Candidatus Regiella insecticola]|uniref:Endonuclease YncB, thermonuclease family n=1 Tax=Candidatus Regiella insecticola TaxID=138073 RepID=A0A6L2ZPR2_9ENTR|nr:thermonuclease family protein [Candidatus Regiella insecticola]GFN46783.1 endonuclease YncB, thermonuclease family [Candidatus Regiella insecticola]
MNKIISFFIAALLFSSSVLADIFEHVVNIADDDTLNLLTEKKKIIKIRLAGIDTPEKGQPFWKKSKNFLSSLVLEKDIIVKDSTKDHYGRTGTVANVYVSDNWINAELVKTETAWMYRKYTKNKILLQIEKESQEKKSSKKTEISTKKINNFDCKSKKYCKEMSSCEEARFYLNQCGMSRLDRYKDGIPCENLCN